MTEKWLVLNYYNLTPIRLKVSAIDAYHFNAQYDYTDVWLSSGVKLPIKERPEEIDELIIGIDPEEPSART